MRSIASRIGLCGIAALLALGLEGAHAQNGAAITSSAQISKAPETSSDGLTLKEKTRSKVVYVKPGATLSNYSSVMILDCFVEMAKNWQHDYNLDELGLDGRVEDRDVQRIKKDLENEFTSTFTKVLKEDGHPVVDKAGPGVLILRPALINVEVAAPDVLRSSRSRSYVDSAGSMTLYLEIYDSTTNDLLVRFAEAREDDRYRGQVANSVTNLAAADEMLERWAKELSSNLGALVPGQKSR